MHSFKELIEKFNTHFSNYTFNNKPASLYEPLNYFLANNGKRIRPVLCLMGSELFDEITDNAYCAAMAVEYFHNFSLIHDDIMDAAALRRGMETVHKKYGANTALLSGDVLLILCYEHINKISNNYLPRILQLFNKTAKEVCEGQQLDMDFEKEENVLMDEYINMISLKTSVLLAASLEMGAILGGASEGNCRNIYEFGKNLGIAFQIQDDYLDAFGNPEKFGKEVGGDVRQNKKTFLWLHVLATANNEQKAELQSLIKNNPKDKVERVLKIYKDCNVGEWANKLKEKYFQLALKHLNDIAVVALRKKPLLELTEFLIQRDY
ncbi:MAG: polyprenyl synthetase family protein [Bacteroidetes bacterium]|nr:polyprenyl synthetase family protein [Bacteroidota bacterium]MBS1650108.1 polyprenyl synthetase family protein [Bacteroidota bacterium]